MRTGVRDCYRQRLRSSQIIRAKQENKWVQAASPWCDLTLPWMLHIISVYQIEAIRKQYKRHPSHEVPFIELLVYIPAYLFSFNYVKLILNVMLFTPTPIYQIINHIKKCNIYLWWFNVWLLNVITNLIRSVTSCWTLPWLKQFYLVTAIQKSFYKVWNRERVKSRIIDIFDRS